MSCGEDLARLAESDSRTFDDNDLVYLVRISRPSVAINAFEPEPQSAVFDWSQLARCWES